MAKRRILGYGESGDTKTTQGYFTAKYYIENKGVEKVRVISSDGGGSFLPYEDSGMIDSGQAQCLDVSGSQLSYAVMNKLSEGYWPDRITRFYQPHPKATWKRDFKTNKVGGYIYEGLTSLSFMWLGNLAHNESPGFKHSFTFEEGMEGEDKYIVGGLQEGHYGMLQGECYRLFHKGFNVLPIEFLYVTARVAKGEDKKTATTVYAPKGIGNAQNLEYPSWFMDTLHLAEEKVKVKVDGVEKIEKAKVAWFTKHRDKATGIEYLAKPRVLSEFVPKLMTKFPKGYVKLSYDRGIMEYLEFLDTLKVVKTNTTEDKDKDN